MSSTAFFYLIPLSLACVGVGLLVVGFSVARKMEDSFPGSEGRVSLSLLVGIVATFVSLSYVEARQSRGDFLNLEGARFVRGWPASWYGYEGIGLWLAPVYFMLDVGFWSFVALTALFLAGFIKRRSSPVARDNIYVAMALLVSLFPLASTPLSQLYHVYVQVPFQARERERLEQEKAIRQHKYDEWVRKSIDEAKRAITLDGCDDHLVPSDSQAGVFSIQVQVTARVRQEHRYWIDAYLQNEARTETLGVSRIDQALPSGDHPLEFVFPTVDASGPLIHYPGPYRVEVRVSLIEFGDRFLDGPSLTHATGALGISDDGLKVNCQTKPYQLEDFTATTQP